MLPPTTKVFNFICCFFVSAAVLGQEALSGSGPPAPSKSCPFCPPELPMAIDTHVAVLIVAGVLYGAYVIYKRRKAINIPQ